MVAINTFSTLFVAAVVAVSAAPTPSPSPLLGPLGGHGQAAEPSCTVPCFSPDTDSDQSEYDVILDWTKVWVSFLTAEHWIVLASHCSHQADLQGSADWSHQRQPPW